MRKTFLLAGLVLLLTAFSACASGDKLSIDATLTIPNAFATGSSDNGIQVQFLRVENDSRCPAGVQCIRAGEAFVVLSTTVDSRSPQESRLEVAPGIQATFDVDRYRITLLELRPDPPPVGGVAQDQYELLLRIEES